MDTWSDDLLDITSMEDIKQHFQYHMNIFLDDDDEELDCIREGERGVDLVEAGWGCPRETGSREELVTQNWL